MTFIPWPNGVQLCFDFTTAGQNWQFCLALRKSTGAPSSTDLANAGADGYAAWLSDLKSLITTQTTLNQVRATDMTAQGAPQSVTPVSDAGTAAGASAALSNAVCVSGRTAKRGRSYRGRTYISGWDHTYLTDPVTVHVNLATGLTGFMTAVQTALDAHGFDVVVPSTQHNGVATSPAELNEVIAFVADTKVDSQRRRLAGRGT